ncbi:rhamnan synthesis F family protein [Treponema primitia]|uniref:rhamnan synthesis F family protein n=1 Tax=Treponema primitia TaxID=88058 RepID=UPI003981073D
MKRILLFVHYNKYNNPADYVIYLLEHIKHIYSRIVFISNSPISEAYEENLRIICNTIIVRENKGFDFGAWKDGICQETWGVLEQYDNLTLMNDTCFGPLFDMEPIYQTMENRDPDFWGLTVFPASSHGMPGTHGPIPEHIQSYFICLSNRVVKSEIFRKFWQNVQYEINVEKVIRKYETQLTLILQRAGFNYTVLYNTLKQSGIMYHSDLSTWYPDLCLANDVPFIKVKSFIKFPNPKYIKELVNEKTDYPVSLIDDHVFKIYNPNVSLSINNKLIAARLSGDSVNVPQKIAIHLHVYFIDVFKQYITLLDGLKIRFSLFITTDTLEKKEKIKSYLIGHISGRSLIEIINIENRGRDIIPWLSIEEKLREFDIVGHFHTKKSSTSEAWTGLSWQKEIFNLLIKPTDEIIKTFNVNDKIGIIIPEIPFYFHIFSPLHFSRERRMQKIMEQLWIKMGCRKELDFKALLTAIMPCGTMFWYRPNALKPLFELQLKAQDVPAEPIMDGTILHCLERMLVYIAWNEGFDYRIMASESRDISYFEDNILLNGLMNSRVYRLFNLFSPLKSVVFSLRQHGICITLNRILLRLKNIF